MRLLGGLGLLAPLSLLALWAFAPETVQSWTDGGTRSIVAAIAAASSPSRTEGSASPFHWLHSAAIIGVALSMVRPADMGCPGSTSSFPLAMMATRARRRTRRLARLAAATSASAAGVSTLPVSSKRSPISKSAPARRTNRPPGERSTMVSRSPSIR
jgi:hypothetical protein